MSLPEPISINSVDSTQERLNDGYEMISDNSIQNDSRELDSSKQRITYSRHQLVDVYRSLANSECPEWITNNLNFPKRLDGMSMDDYLNNLVENDFTHHLECWRDKYWEKSRKPVDGIVKKKELGIEDEERNDQFDPGNGNNFRLNLNHRAGQDNGPNKEFINKGNYGSNYTANAGFNNHPNNNLKNINPPNKFNERQPFNNNYRNNDRTDSRLDGRNNENRIIDDRIDNRGFLRSRGENLNQNFASFRRFQNRNQSDRYNNYTQRRDVEPEWFTEGPISQHDTIELKGFDEDEDRSNASRSAGINQQQIMNKSSPSHQIQSQQPFKLNIAPANQQQQHDAKAFDISDFANIDWQNVDERNQNVDKATIENQANSSRFARWFNEPHHHQQTALNNSATEEQIEKLFSSARTNVNQIATPINYVNPTPQFSPQQQQINLQNDFFGNLMHRNPQPQQYVIKPQHPHQQIIDNRSQQQHNSETTESMNQASKKTDQQLFDILQKARINVNSLMAQQNVLNKDNVIRGQAKSAEELEASLLSNGSPPMMRETNIQTSHQSHQINPTELFQKMCLNSNIKFELSEVQQQPIGHQEDNRAINPFVLNLLDDAQRQKPIASANSPTSHLMNQPMRNQMNNQAINNNLIKNPMNNRSNHMPVYSNNHQSEARREVNPFMPTSVIRKIAKEKNNLIGNRGISEANFEIVTGNNINDRSVLGNRARETDQLNHQKGIIGNFTMNQAGLMQQNFAITTGNRWNDGSVQQHSIDSTTSNHKVDPEEVRNFLLQFSGKPAQQQQTNANASLGNNFALPKNQGHPIQSFAKVVQNDSQKKLIEILQKASTNFGKTPATDSTGNKINDWFELEMQRNNNHLSPIIKENAFTLEDIENN